MKCKNPAKTDKREKKVNCIISNDDIIAVHINDTKVPAMLDTGSFKTLLRADEFHKIGGLTLRPTSRVIKGFAKTQRCF